MKLKQQLLATLALAALMPVQTYANPVEYKIPATQEEFKAQWEIIPGTVDGTWTWVDADTPYAETPAISNSANNSSGLIGATLVYSTPIEMKKGDIYYFQANVCSADYDDEERFYIVVGTDKQNLQKIAEDASAFYVYRQRYLASPNFQYKPADTHSKRIYTVPEDGTYYFGIRNWYGGGSFDQSSKRLQLADVKIEKDVDFPAKVTDTKATAASNGSLEVTLEWKWPSTSKNNNALTGNLGARIYRSTSNSKSDLYKEENVIATVTNGVPGEMATFIDNAANSSSAISVPGQYYYYIAPYDDNGENSECSSSQIFNVKWVGEDVKPLNPLSPVAKAVGDNVEISWTPRKEGANGGMLLPEYLTLTIARKKDSGEFVKIVEGYTGDSPYLDTNLEGFGKYTYELYYVYKETESTHMTTTAISAGGGMEIPYTQDFEDSGSMNLMTVVQNSYSYKWARYYDGTVYLSGTTSTYYDPTSNIMTPPLKLKEGKVYKISCSSWVDNASSPVDLTFTMGTQATMTDQQPIETVTVNNSSSDKVTYEVYVSPDSDNNYFVGFKATNRTSGKIYLDNIQIEEGVAGPGKVGDLTFVPDANGENKATVTFTIPDKTNVGTELTSLTKVVVSRSDKDGALTAVKTLSGSDAAPGKAVSFEDNVPEAGMYSYSVVSTLDDIDSKPATTDAAWVGYDVPKRASAPSYSLNDEGNVSITWNAPTGTLSTHGGYVDAENLKYRVYRIAKLAGTKEAIATVADIHYIDSDIHNQEWDQYSYGISFVNGDQEGLMADAYSTIKAGKVQSWPYNPDFTSEAFVNSFEGRGFVHDNGLNFKNKGSEYDSSATIAYLPPFHISGSDKKNYSMTLNVSRSNADYEEKLDIILCTISTGEPMSLRSGKVGVKAAAIPGSDSQNLLKTISVTATPDAPATEVVPVSVPDAGKYRMAIRLASPENKGVTVHSLSMAVDDSNNVEELQGAATGMFVYDGMLMLPENTVAVEIFALDGTCVMSSSSDTASVSLRELAKGIYIVKAVTSGNQVISAKISI